MKRAILPALFLLAACATGPTLAERLSGYVGRPEADLVAGLGVPLRVYEGEGRRFLEFGQQRLLAVPAPYVGAWNRRGGGGFGGTTYTPVSCGITFAIRDGRAESFTYRGDGCW